MTLVPPASSGASAGASLNPGSSRNTGGSGGVSFQAAGSIATSDPQAMAGWGIVAQIGASSTAWPVASTAIFIPFSVQVATTIARIGWGNGITISGNVDAGLYNEDGTQIAHIGSTAQAGASAVQSVAIGPSALAVGSYYMALAVDNITATIQTVSPSLTAILRTLGVQAQTSAFPLPATATFANPAAAYLPSMAISQQTFI